LKEQKVTTFQRPLLMLGKKLTTTRTTATTTRTTLGTAAKPGTSM